MYERIIALRLAAARRRIRRLASAVVGVALFGGVSAQAADLPAAAAADPLGVTTWGGIGWGIGIAADFDIGGKRITDAQIVNDIVRVTDTSSNVKLGFVLEAHYFLRDFILQSSLKNAMCAPPLQFCQTEVAVGPFIAIEVGNGTASTPSSTAGITGYALGLMVGFHHIPLDKPPAVDKTSWNFGIGLRVDPSAQVLGDGFVANQPPPAGETAIRWLKQPRPGIMLLSSFSF